jgi:S-disulfanyl-L-cysteine oxidoreductase SoxD
MQKNELRYKYRRVAAAAAFLSAALAASFAIAQPSTPVTPSLSFTQEQVANGHAEYTTSCVDCHGPNLDDGEFGGPPLKGDAFRAKWFGHPVSALLGFTHSAMPPDAPGRLPMGTYVEIIAYLLSVNGISPGASELPSDMNLLTQIRIPAPGQDTDKK